jgi:predicted TIM-barrel fold metal-dependent hydrolase
VPYLNDYWRDQVTTRGMTDLVSQSYPTNSPISSRPDWRPAKGKPGSSLKDMQAQALDPFGTAFGICNPLYGVQMVFSEDMADAFCRALNDWLVKEWLDKDARLRGSIVIPVQSVEKSVAEIERCAGDSRFVQVLMLVMGDMPLGKRAYWPIYAAAERLGLAIGIHAGSNYHNPPTSVGWGSYHIEDYVAQAQVVPDPVDQPDRGGRVRAASAPQNGDAGKRLYLAAAVSVAAAQVLARHPHGNAVGGPRAAGDCAQQHPLFPAADRRAAGPRDIKSPV